MGIESLKRSIAMIGAGAAVWALCSCASVGPDYRPPDVQAQLPAQWSAGTRDADASATTSRAVEQSASSSLWWTVFKDPVLDRLMNEALAQNLSLQSAGLRIAAARIQRDTVASNAMPSLAGTGLAGRTRFSENGFTKSLSGNSNSQGASAPSPYANVYQAGFDALWELDLWGKTRRGVEAADADIRSADEDRNDAALSLTAEIGRTYLNLRGTQRQRAIVLADRETQRELLRLAESRNAAGLAPVTDAVSQRAELASTEASLPQLNQSIAQGTNRLAQLLGLPPGALRERLADAPKDTIADLPPEVPIGLPGDLLRRRPDIRRSEAQLQSATAQIGVATASLFPDIRLGAVAGFQSAQTGHLFDWASRFFLGGTQITLPVFEGGRLRAQVRLADLQAQQATLAYRQTVLDAVHDAENALIAYADEQRRAGALQVQVAQARRGRELSMSRYRAGLAPMIEVLDAERSAHQADASLNRSAVTSATQLIALYKALGGEWQEPPAPPQAKAQ